MVFRSALYLILVIDKGTFGLLGYVICMDSKRGINFLGWILEQSSV
jgi:hypothetical protein